ncbi:immunity 26/phosphotriesterase HocA family protein [Ruminococcus sp.]|uniref:immunity 26/phosphotriesterase HocA family protein n=1 Tax=Ruminococcus sp. TaxID=41978 RepID=UPI0025CE9961|nr:immunity 26/phosphotriesterase HocA family protein [Ruminococcus sp.]MBQ8965542.1 immunity 26/phosphotriesterase HocA family protein [Ruminococcus sp.]
MTDKKALGVLKKYYLTNIMKEQPTESEWANGIKSGVLAEKSCITHDEMTAEIKALAERISLEKAAKGFLYSLSSGDMRYRSAVSSLVWARALPAHELVSDGAERTEWRRPVCVVCGCSHGLESAEEVDWNKYNVFRYLPPKQYGSEPDYSCAEYVLNDLREFEKLPPVEPCEEDYSILNGIFACVAEMKPHNMDTALLAEIRKRKFFEATGNAIHCILGILSVCGILEGAENKGFLHSFANFDEHGMGRDGLSFYPLNFWRGREGVNYQAVKEVFGSFCGDKLSPEKAVVPEKTEEASVPPKKAVSKAEQYFREGEYAVMLTNEERKYLALDPMNDDLESETMFSVTHILKKRTTLFYQGDTIVKVIYEEYAVNDEGRVLSRNYTEFDTRLETEERKMLRPKTGRGRAKPVTPSNVMAGEPYGGTLDIYLKKGESGIWAGNYRNNQKIAIGETERIKKILTDEDFHEFMRYYISTCPDDYFEQVDEVRNTGHQTVKFREGDIFRCRADREHYAYGLIIGSTRKLEKWQELPETHSFRSLMTMPIVVRMYDFITDNADMTPEELADRPLRAPDICSDNDILWGTHKIVAHKELVPEDIQFELQLARVGKRNEHFNMFTAETFVKMSPKKPKPEMKAPRALYVEWGFASFEVPWDEVPDNIRKLLEEDRCFNGGVSLGITSYFCGRTMAELLAKYPKLYFSLLTPEKRDKFNMVMEFLGLPADSTLDDFAKKYGGITRAEYIELLKKRSK